MLIRFHGADRTVTGSCHLVEVAGLRVMLDFGMYQGPRELAREINSTLPDALRHLDAVILSHGHLDHCGRLPVLWRSGYRGPIYATPATIDVARIVMTDAAKIQQEDADYLNRRSPRPPHRYPPNYPSAPYDRNRGRDDRNTDRDDRHRDDDSSEGGIRPLFTLEDVQGVLSLFKPAKYLQRVSLGHGVSFTFFEAGHILGSAYVILQSDHESAGGGGMKSGEGNGRGNGKGGAGNGGGAKLLFTGDIGRFGTPILRDPYDLALAAPDGVDAVITEATYGTVRHAPMSEVGPQLLAILREAAAKKSGGRVILPSFAVGRTQTMLWYVQRFIQSGELPPMPIFVDSPMGSEVSRITQTHADYYDEETRKAVCDPNDPASCDLFGMSNVTFARTPDESRKINDVRVPCVIIASSPTCEFGRVLHHLKRSVENPDDTIVFVGWTPPNTLGRRLQAAGRELGGKGAELGVKSSELRGDAARTGLSSQLSTSNSQLFPRVRILDRLYELRCQVRTLHGLSAHADGDELLRFLAPVTSERTTAYVVHGEEDRCDAFAARLTAAGMRAAIAPATGSVAVVAPPHVPSALPTLPADSDPVATDE